MKKLLLAVLVATTAVAFSTHSGAKPKSDRILFVNVTLIDGDVYLVDTKVVKGTLKKQKGLPSSGNYLYFSVLSKSGTVLYEGAIPDPSLISVEYEDEGGQLQRQTSVLKSVDFAVRMPFDEAASQVIFYKIEKVPDGLQRVGRKTRQVGSVEFEVGGDDDEK